VLLDRFRPGAVAAAGLCAALALAACKYGYDNPAERLEAGMISGRTVADPGATGTAHPSGGIGVSLKGSAFDQVTHDTGRFSILPLPPGQHTLLFRHGAQLALVRRVRVELGADGQPDGVALGDVPVPFAAVIEGTVDDTQHGGVVVDEITGLGGSVAGGAYRLQGASLGDHLLKFGLLDPGTGQAWVGGPLDLTLGDEQQSSIARAALVAVHPAAGVGRLRLRLVSLQPGLAPADIAVTLEDLVRGPWPSVPAPDAGGRIELEVPEGVYRIAIAPPAAHAAEVTAPAPALTVVIEGEVADVGALYLVPPGVPLAAQRRCVDSADCSGLPCLGGACSGWQPPPVLPASVPFCYARARLCTPGGACQLPGGVQGACFGVSAAVQACAPCGAACTYDGTSALQAPPPNPASGICLP